MKKCITLLLGFLLLSGCAAGPSDAPQAATVSSFAETAAASQGGHTVTDAESSALPAEVEGGGVRIALLDTGVSTKAIDPARLLPGHNYVAGAAGTDDLINHGTAVASVILGCDSAGVAGIAPEAYIIPLVIVTKLDGETKSASPQQLAQAIRDSVDIYRADIINVSLGVRENNAALREAAAYAVQKGVPVISAVGNGGEAGKPYYPAAYDTVLSVGACDKAGHPADFSQAGAQVLAPGSGILLASRNGVAYGVKGTSFATGYVSACAANILAKEPTLSAEDLYGKLIAAAESFLFAAD